MCAKIVSAFAQPAMKFVSGMLSLFLMMDVKWAVIFPYDEHTRKLVTRWRACTKIGCKLAKHARNLLTPWLSMRENWLLVGEHTQKLVSRWLSRRENW
jgi:hypothetical protein